MYISLQVKHSLPQNNLISWKTNTANRITNTLSFHYTAILNKRKHCMRKIYVWLNQISIFLVGEELVSISIGS